MKVHQVGVADVWAIAADTDGIDGSEDNAGAVLAPDSIRKGGDAKDRLAKKDSYGFFGESRLDPPHVEIARAEVGGKGDQAGFAAFFSSVASAACSTRSIRVTSARGALSPLRKPVLRIRR